MAAVCPGHELDPDILARGSRKYAQLSLRGFLGAARRVSQATKSLTTDAGLILGAWNLEEEHKEAARAGNLDVADRMYLDYAKIEHSSIYDETLETEALAREFSHALAYHVRHSDTIYRWMKLPELWSYGKGTFDSRMPGRAGCRGCKLFSLGTNRYAGRPAWAEVPAGEIRCKLRPAAYTALPCPVLPKDETIDSRKHIDYAQETECRVPDGTRVPKGTRIFVRNRALDALPDRTQYYDLLESLGNVAEIRLI